MLYRVLPREMRLKLARLIGALGAVSALIGIVAGFSDHGWKLGITSWILLGVFGAVAKIAILFDQHMEDKGAKGG